ncbi:MAG: urea ABC transporter permease subunit UrtB, partial [Roseicyclus sp.]
MIRALLAALVGVVLLSAQPLRADTVETAQDLQSVLQSRADLVADASRQTVQEVLDLLIASELPEVPRFLATWAAREVYQRNADGIFVYVEDPDGDPLTLLDITTGEVVGTATSREVSQLRPNRGVQTVIASALVAFQLGSDDPAERLAALEAIDDAPEETHLPLLRDLLGTEEDPDVAAFAEVLLPKLVIAFDTDDADRVAAIESLAGNVSLAARATLNPLLATRTEVAAELPEGINLARTLEPGTDIDRGAAYAMLVEAGLAPAPISATGRRDILAANVADGMVGGLPVAQLNTEAARDRAYAALVAAGLAQPAPTEAEIDDSLATHV